jgi:hypothetical protein
MLMMDVEENGRWPCEVARGFNKLWHRPIPFLLALELRSNAIPD